MEYPKTNTSDTITNPTPIESERRRRMNSFLGQTALKALEFGQAASLMFAAQKIAIETALPQGEVTVPAIVASSAAFVVGKHYYNKENKNEADKSPGSQALG